MQLRLAAIFDKQHDAKLALLHRLRKPDVPHRSVLIDELVNVIAAHYAVLEEVVFRALPSSDAHIASVMDSQKTLVSTVAELMAARHDDDVRQAALLDAVEARIRFQRSHEKAHLLPCIELHLSHGDEAMCSIDAQVLIERRAGR
jgi:hypothetical protein